MITPALQAAIVQAAHLLRQAGHAVAFTGAGISTPSGIPDFRSAGSGLWQHTDPMKAASLTSFRRTPQVFFDWLRPLAEKIERAQPNPAHSALARLEKAGIVQALITQNIDGLHQRAGSRLVLELHGSLRTLTCPSCRTALPSAPFWKPFLEEGILPRCAGCGHLLKPDIVLFEEMLPTDTWQAAEEQARAADVFLVVGSSLEVMPAAGLPYTALRRQAALILNNYTPTALDAQAAVLLPLDAAEALPLIAQHVLA